MGLSIGGAFDKKGIYYLTAVGPYVCTAMHMLAAAAVASSIFQTSSIASLHFHKLMNDVGLSFMDSKAKNKESKRPLIGIENSAKRRQDIEHDYP